MDLSTFGGLKSAVIEYLVRPDLTDAAPTWVRLFETKFSRIMRLSEMEATATLTPGADGTATLPTDFADVRYVEANCAPGYMLQAGTGAGLAAIAGQQGITRSYFLGGGQIHTAPISQYGLTLVYYARVPALQNDADTNWLLTKYPDVYLYGSLVEATAYTMDDTALQRWAALYEKALQDIRAGDGGRWNAGAVHIAGRCP